MENFTIIQLRNSFISDERMHPSLAVNLSWELLKIRLLISPLAKFLVLQKKLLRITFLFDECHHSRAAVTPVKYQRDNVVTSILTMAKI